MVQTGGEGNAIISTTATVRGWTARSMLKKMVLTLVLIAVTATTGLLEDRTKDLIREWAATPTGLALLSFIALMAGVFVVYVLEHERALPLNWWWHRLWYLHDLSRYLKKQQEEELGGSDGVKRDVPTKSVAEVLVEGERRDVVRYILDKIQQSRRDPLRFLVLGETGSGKSFAIARLGLELARHGGWKPYSVPMPVLCRMGGFREGGLLGLISKEISLMTKGNSGKILSAGIEHLMRKKRIILLFDALDETPEKQREFAVTELRDLAKPARGDVHMVITARPREVQPVDFSELSIKVLEIQDLSDQAVEVFIKAYAQIEPSPSTSC
jgi:hypothetical protein